MLIAYLFLKDRCDVEILCDCNTLINAKKQPTVEAQRKESLTLGKLKVFLSIQRIL